MSSLYVTTHYEMSNDGDLVSNKAEKDSKPQPGGTEQRWSIRLAAYFRRLIQALREPDATARLRFISLCAFASLSLVGFYARRRGRMKGQLLSPPDRNSASEVPLSLLIRALNNREPIEKAFFSPYLVYYLSKGSWKRSTLPHSSPRIQADILQNLSDFCPDVSALPEPLSNRLASPALAALPFVYLAFVYRLINRMSGGDVSSKTSSEIVHTTFRDVAGIDSVLLEVAEVVSFYSVGAQAPRGILLYGPPGSGKTLLARATAGEACVDSFIACSASDFVEMYVGRGAARVRSIFDKARTEARRKHGIGAWWNVLLHPSKKDRKPCAILFIDELDALAKTRSTLSSNDEREQTLNQLLTEMDGFTLNSDVTLVVMAATNRADILDPAVLRRFDRQIEVGYPDAVGRKSILMVHQHAIKTSNSIDWERLVSDAMTVNFSGADLRNVVNEAALLAVRENCLAVQQNHLEHAVRRIRQSKHSVPEQNNAVPFHLFR